MDTTTLLYYIYLIPVILLSFSIHELAHASVSYRLGDPTARNQGRLTLNPLKHLDPLGTIMVLASTLSRGMIFGWAKPVPINPMYYRDRKKGTMLVSLAGPLTNILVALVFSIPMALIGIKYGENPDNLFVVGNAYFSSMLNFDGILFNISRLFYVMNISLAVFNIIPVPPLDGSKILAGILPDRQYFKLLQYENIIGIVFLVVMFMFPTVLTTVLRPISWIFSTAIKFITSPILGILG